MKLYSTKREAPHVFLEEAVKTGLAPDGGLYIPEEFPTLSAAEIDAFHGMAFNDMAERILGRLFNNYIPETDLRGIIDAAFDFDAPLHWLDEERAILELFHGPTLAFKDFGARFMGRLLEYFLRNENKTVDILVATSGDTGSAVAHGFLKAEGIRVTILYPRGKVSEIQERQFATLGDNIRVLEIEGTFDDCQRLVKQAFVDPALNESLTLSSANSINIARLIPQMLYYFRAVTSRDDRTRPVVFTVPSGNFGNLTAGLFARKMGLPVEKFVAANNANDIYTQYWTSGRFEPRPSVQTLSNAMDVGDPSNFQRMLDLYDHQWTAMRADIPAYAFSDAQTKQAITEVSNNYSYTICPHTAVGYLGAAAYAESHPQAHRNTTRRAYDQVILATAHPVKFKDIVEDAIGREVAIPQRLLDVMGSEKKSIPMEPSFDSFRDFLMQNK